ncbi:9721_t:CDS:1, partial [Entrophospora sp. SA101]
TTTNPKYFGNQKIVTANNFSHHEGAYNYCEQYQYCKNARPSTSLYCEFF